MIGYRFENQWITAPGGLRRYRIFGGATDGPRKKSRPKKIKKIHMPLLCEFCRTSRDLFELQLDSLKSRDVRRNSPKSGKQKIEKTTSSGGVLSCGHDNIKKITCHFWANFAERPGICSNCNYIRSNPGTFGEIRQKVSKKTEKKNNLGRLLYHMIIC